MPSAPTPPSNSNELQFDQAIPAQTDGSGSAMCVACQRPLHGVYYGLNGKMVCDKCRESVNASPPGTRNSRVLMALIYGSSAAVVSAFVWYMIRELTGYELGIVAIVVGLFVGNAVKKGSQGVGGLGYQILAVAIVYIAISLTFAPDLIKVFMEKFHEQRDAKVEDDTNSSLIASVASAAPATQPHAPISHPIEANNSGQIVATAAQATTDSPAGISTHKERPSLSKALLALVLFLVIVVGVLLAAPILIGVSSPISILIFGFALWNAWKINRRLKLVFTGPHAILPPPITGASA